MGGKGGCLKNKGITLMGLRLWQIQIDKYKIQEYNERRRKQKLEDKKYGKPVVYSTTVISEGRGYKSYLTSDWWKEIRKRTLQKFNFKCCACGTKENLHVHHSSYRYKNSPRMDKAMKDVVLLCNYCHQDFHKKYGVKSNMIKETQKFIADVQVDIEICDNMNLIV